MKISFSALAAVVALATLPGAAFADVAFNVGAVSDHRDRGIAQTQLEPAVQGGVDFASGGLVRSASVAGTDADTVFHSSAVNGNELGKTMLVAGVKYNF